MALLVRRAVLCTSLVVVMAACGSAAPETAPPSEAPAGQSAGVSVPATTPVVATSAPTLTTFAVLEPKDGALVTSSKAVVAGTAPPGSEIVRDIQFQTDQRTSADAQGRWSMVVDLRKGENELIVRSGDDKSTAITIHIAFNPPEATADAAAVAALGTYLVENFGAAGYETPWWPHVLAWGIRDRTVVITTDLEVHDLDAENICAAASSFAFSEPSFDLREGSVVVIGAGQAVIWTRTSSADRC